MRVAFDATPLLDVRTGIGLFVEELLEHLAVADGIEVVALGYTRIYLDELRSRLPAGIGAIGRPIPARRTRALWKRGDWPPIERWTGPIDVVHGPNYVVPPSRTGVELTSVHDLTPVRFPELCDDNTRQYPQLIRRTLARGGHVHCISAFVADEVVDHFAVPAERVHVVRLGATPGPAGDAAAGRALAGTERYVVALGTIEPRKNLPLLVEAFDAIAGDRPDLGLVVAGREGWGAEAFRAALDRSPHRDRIRTVGYVDDRARADLLAGAALLAYPSKYEGFGLPPLEAMLAGVPVVATAAGAIPEIAGPGVALVPVDDADELAAAMARVLDDEAVRADLVARGREHAAGFTWDRCTEEMLSLYRRLAGVV